MECDSPNCIFPMVPLSKTTRVLLKTFKRRTRGYLGTTQEDFKTTQGLAGVRSSLGTLEVLLRTFGLKNSGMLGNYSSRRSRLLETILRNYKVLGAYCMDIPGPTTLVGTRTDYSVVPGITRLVLHGT
jgi:hypothetical protein